MKIGSLYSGCGGLDLGAEWATGATTAWQLDPTGADVRARHFPDARQITADVLTVDPLDLGRVDVLTAGFACQDLSTAGKQASKADIHAGDRTGPTYRGVLRFVRALCPEIVVLENVPAVLAHRPTIEADLPRYGWTWVQASAIDVGAPHIRARVFAVGVRGSFGGGLVELPSERRWSPGLVDEVRAWPTVIAADSDDVKWNGEGGNPSLNWEARQRIEGQPCSRLNPDWVETLVGLPIGWTETTGPRLEALREPVYPRGRYPADWDRSVLWPGYPWEPSRTLPDGPPCPGRPARLRMCGNIAQPQETDAAVSFALAPRQVGLFGRLGA